MPQDGRPKPSPESDAQRLERLIPVMGVENARRLVASRVSEGQRDMLAKLVAAAPKRVASETLGQ